MRAAAAGLAALAVLVGGTNALAADVVGIKLPASLAATAGQQTVAAVEVTVKRGYHVQANPVRNPALIPIVLDMRPAEAVTPGAPIYPLSKIMRLEGSDEDLVVYDGTFTIQLPLTVSREALPGPVTLSGTLRFQACDDKHCLFPVTAPVKLVIQVGR